MDQLNVKDFQAWSESNRMNSLKVPTSCAHRSAKFQKLMQIDAGSAICGRLSTYNYSSRALQSSGRRWESRSFQRCILARKSVSNHASQVSPRVFRDWQWLKCLDRLASLREWLFQYIRRRLFLLMEMLRWANKPLKISLKAPCKPWLFREQLGKEASNSTRQHLPRNTRLPLESNHEFAMHGRDKLLMRARGLRYTFCKVDALSIQRPPERAKPFEGLNYSCDAGCFVIQKCTKWKLDAVLSSRAPQPACGFQLYQVGTWERRRHLHAENRAPECNATPRLQGFKGSRYFLLTRFATAGSRKQRWAGHVMKSAFGVQGATQCPRWELWGSYGWWATSCTPWAQLGYWCYCKHCDSWDIIDWCRILYINYFAIGERRWDSCCKIEDSMLRFWWMMSSQGP